MTERERWTVYPLLFLSLGIGLRSHITSSLDLNDITCHTLKSRAVEITGADDHVRLVLSSQPAPTGGGGVMTIFSAEGKPEMVLRSSPQGGAIEMGSAKGIRQVVVAVAPPGGFVQTFDAEGKVVRTLAVSANPEMLIRFGPPPAPPADESSADQPGGDASSDANEPATDKANEPEPGKPADADAPAEKSPGAGDDPADR